MVVYDFDKTIYDGDSTLDFYLFCLKKKPLLARYIPFQLLALIKYLLGIFGKTKFKEHFYCFLKGSKNTDLLVNEFWKRNIGKIMPWYLRQKTEKDVIISASPEFLLKPACDKIGIQHLIASRVCPKTGAYSGENCYGAEKVIRFREVFGDSAISSFYSDSLSDAPLAEIAEHSYIVKKDSQEDWNDYNLSKIEKVKSSFFSKEFLVFVCIGLINAFNGIVFSFLFSMFLTVNIAFISGYLLSLTVSYLLNSKVAFRETFSLWKYIKFCVSYIPNFIIQNFFVFLFYNRLGVDKLITYALAALIGIPATFLMVRFLAFGRKTPQSPGTKNTAVAINVETSEKAEE